MIVSLQLLKYAILQILLKFVDRLVHSVFIDISHLVKLSRKKQLLAKVTLRHHLLGHSRDNYSQKTPHGHSLAY